MMGESARPNQNQSKAKQNVFESVGGRRETVKERAKRGRVRFVGCWLAAPPPPPPRPRVVKSSRFLD